jgi:hypothetical protein
VQKQLSPGVTMAAWSDYDGSRLIHHAPGHDLAMHDTRFAEIGGKIVGNGLLYVLSEKVKTRRSLIPCAFSKWWARKVLNLRPLQCQICALMGLADRDDEKTYIKQGSTVRYRPSLSAAVRRNRWQVKSDRRVFKQLCFPLHDEIRMNVEGLRESAIV